MFYCLVPWPHTIYFTLARYSLFVLKVPLNTNQPANLFFCFYPLTFPELSLPQRRKTVPEGDRLFGHIFAGAMPFLYCPPRLSKTIGIRVCVMAFQTSSRAGSATGHEVWPASSMRSRSSCETGATWVLCFRSATFDRWEKKCGLRFEYWPGTSWRRREKNTWH